MAEYHKCKICGSEKVSPLRSFLKNDKYKLIYKCAICDFSFDVGDNRYAFYADDYFDKYVVDENARSARHSEADWLADQCTLSGTTFMEIGPGLGHFMEQLKKRAPDIKLNAIEMAPLAAAACRAQGAQVLEKDWESLPYSELLPYYANCDLVASIHSIEHMEDPLPALRKMAWMLKPGGILYVHTPNHDHARNENWFHYHLEHVALFGECSLRVAFDLVNLSVITVRKLYGDDLIVIGQKK